MPGPDLRFAPPRPAVVPARRLAEVVARVRGRGPTPSTDDPNVTGLTHDSRCIQRGDLYAALPGAHTHGARFAADALAAGAVAILTDDAGSMLDGPLPTVVVPDPRAILGDLASWIYGEPSTKLRVLGVTGTNGKTTTSYLLDAGLRAAGERTGLIGTIETRVGDEVLQSARTTPEAPDLQALFAVMTERRIGSVAMEVSSHALALRRVDGTRFDVVSFTNLSQDHLDFHADITDYFAAKARLFTPGFARVGVVNIDDEYGRRLLGIAAIPLVTVSAKGADADWRASEVSTDAAGSRFVVVGPRTRTAIELRLPGAFNVANALLAFGTLVTAGIDPDAAAEGIGALTNVPGRMESIDAGQPFVALVDYAHTPDAVETLLTTLRGSTEGRLIVVLGCGGDRDRAKRPLMGAAAARLADVAVLTSDNPRSEDPVAIAAAMIDGAMGVVSAQRAEIVVELDRAAAIAIAVNSAAPGDVVVVAGKGHEQGQEVAGAVYPFDDRTVVRDQLAALAGGRT